MNKMKVVKRHHPLYHMIKFISIKILINQQNNVINFNNNNQMNDNTSHIIIQNNPNKSKKTKKHKNIKIVNN